MNRLWHRISEHILAPSQLNGAVLLDLLSPRGRSDDLQRHAASVIQARVQLIAALFAVLVPLAAIVDWLVFDPATARYLTALRFASAAIFLVLAWPRPPSSDRGYGRAMGNLALLLLVPSLFHLMSLGTLNAAAQTPVEKAFTQLYAYLPTVVLGGLAIFPLTALESLLLSLPVLILGSYSLSLAEPPLSLAQHGGALWFMLMMLGVAMFSCMSQCHYMTTLVVRALHDPLTAAYTRQSGEEAIQLLYRLNQMAGKPLTLAFIDLDRFKSINDNFGHEAGDQCLRQFADRLRAGLRRSDLLIRWGGEEFVVALPDTPPENAATLLRRLRATGFGWRPDGAPLTASIGIANSGEPHSAYEILLKRADERMYAAKDAGRDRVVWADGRCEPLAPSDPVATTSTSA